MLTALCRVIQNWQHTLKSPRLRLLYIGLALRSIAAALACTLPCTMLLSHALSPAESGRTQSLVRNAFSR